MHIARWLIVVLVVTVLIVVFFVREPVLSDLSQVPQ